MSSIFRTDAGNYIDLDKIISIDPIIFDYFNACQYKFDIHFQLLEKPKTIYFYPDSKDLRVTKQEGFEFLKLDGTYTDNPVDDDVVSYRLVKEAQDKIIKAWFNWKHPKAGHITVTAEDLAIINKTKNK